VHYEEDPLPHLHEVEEWEEDVRLAQPPKQTRKSMAMDGKEKMNTTTKTKNRPNRDEKDKDKSKMSRSKYRREKRRDRSSKVQVDQMEKEDDRFVGAPAKWTEVWSPKVCIYICKYTYECEHVFINIQIYMYMYKYIYVYVYMYMYVHMCIHKTHIHVLIHISSILCV